MRSRQRQNTGNFGYIDCPSAVRLKAAEPTVAVVDANADKHGTRKLAEAYLKFLYTPDGQDLAAKHYFRPRLAEVATKYAAQFPQLDLVTIDHDFGGWKAAQAKHFADGGTFDQIYKPGQ